MAKSDVANGDPLVDLFGYVKDVLTLLKIDPELGIFASKPSQIALVKIISEFVIVFAMATKEVTCGLRLCESILIGKRRKSLSNVALR
jgi:hypothetical protein